MVKGFPSLCSRFGRWFVEAKASEPLALVRSRQARDKDRAWRASNDLLSHTPRKQPAQPFAPVRAHDDEVALAVSRGVDDRVGRIALNDDWVQRKFCRDLCQVAFEVSLQPRPVLLRLRRSRLAVRYVLRTERFNGVKDNQTRVLSRGKLSGNAKGVLGAIGKIGGMQDGLEHGGLRRRLGPALSYRT